MHQQPRGQRRRIPSCDLRPMTCPRENPDQRAFHSVTSVIRNRFLRQQNAPQRLPVRPLRQAFQRFFQPLRIASESRAQDRKGVLIRLGDKGDTDSTTRNTRVRWCRSRVINQRTRGPLRVHRHRPARRNPDIRSFLQVWRQRREELHAQAVPQAGPIRVRRPRPEINLQRLDPGIAIRHAVIRENIFQGRQNLCPYLMRQPFRRAQRSVLSGNYKIGLQTTDPVALLHVVSGRAGAHAAPSISCRKARRWARASASAPCSSTAKRSARNCAICAMSSHRRETTTCAGASCCTSPAT